MESALTIRSNEIKLTVEIEENLGYTVKQFMPQFLTILLGVVPSIKNQMTNYRHLTLPIRRLDGKSVAYQDFW